MSCFFYLFYKDLPQTGSLSVTDPFLTKFYLEFRFQEKKFEPEPGFEPRISGLLSLALLPIELSKFPFQFMFKRSS